VYLLLGRPSLAELAGVRGLAVDWMVLALVTLPVYFLFAATRYGGSAAGRWAFGVAIAVHLIVQLIAMGMVEHQRWFEGLTLTFVTVAAVAAVAVPGWVLWRQRVLARSVRRS